MKKVAIYGAGGFGRELSVWIELGQGFGERRFAGFIDDDSTKRTVPEGKQVDDIVVSVAAPAIRREIINKLGAGKYDYHSLVHPDVFVHDSNHVGRGSVICSGVKITTNVHIGEFVIINLNAIIGHDVRMDDFVSVMPSANILGGVVLETGVFVGAGATILQNLRIGAGSIVGAGAVVTRDIPPGKKFMGVPAREGGSKNMSK